MSEEESVVSLIGEQFRRLNQRFDKIELALGDIKGRIIVVAETMASMSARVATVEVSMAGVIKRMDRFEGRLERIERRLDLVDAR